MSTDPEFVLLMVVIVSYSGLFMLILRRLDRLERRVSGAYVQGVKDGTAAAKLAKKLSQDPAAHAAVSVIRERKNRSRWACLLELCPDNDCKINPCHTCPDRKRR